jgi:hypothetical protein
MLITCAQLRNGARNAWEKHGKNGKKLIGKSELE